MAGGGAAAGRADASPPRGSLHCEELGLQQGEPVRLLVAVDRVLRDEREWLRGLALTVDEAENLLFPYIGRRLEVVRTVPWQGSVRQSSADSLLDDLMASVSRGDAEIVIGLARAYSFQGFTDTGDSVGGLANYRGGYAVLMIGGQLGAHHTPVEGLGSLLAHELAHIFGAVHRSDPELLLSTGGTGVRVDALNAALMGMHRQRSFDEGIFPLPVPYHEAARPLYRLAIEEDPSDLNPRLMLARLDLETGRYAEAISALEEILAESPGNLEARGDLELALNLQRERFPTLAQSPGAATASMRRLSPPSFFNHRKVRTCS